MEYKSLKEIARITMGQSPDSSSYNSENDGLPFFQGNADFGEVYPSERVWCNNPQKIAEPGDILISVRAPIGALNYAKDRCCIGRGLAAISVDDEANRNYIFHFLKARNAELNSQGTGSTFKAIGKSVLEDIKVPQIPREEQQRCIKLMDSLESSIRHRKIQLESLDTLIKARFVEMFGEPVKRLDACETVSLETIADRITVGFVGEASNDYTDEGVPYLRTQNVRVNHIDLTGLIHVSDAFHQRNQKSVIHSGDVVISRVGVNRGMAAVIPDNLSEANIANCLIVGETKNIEPYYLAFYMNMSYGKRPQFGASVGSAQGVVNTSVLKKWEVYVPDRKLQSEFCLFAQQVGKSKVAIQKSLDETQHLFDSLMQEYFG